MRKSRRRPKRNRKERMEASSPQDRPCAQAVRIHGEERTPTACLCGNPGPLPARDPQGGLSFRQAPVYPTHKSSSLWERS